jgi:hypothetical protein
VCCRCICRIFKCLVIVYQEQLVKFVIETTGADSKRERESDGCNKIEVTSEKKEKENNGMEERK